MSKGSAPSAPDPYQSAQAQAMYGEQAANFNASLNDTNTVGPTGSTSYQITGYDPSTGAPIRTQTTQLSPAEQKLLSGQQGLQLGEQGAGYNLLGQFNRTATGVPNINPVQYGATGGPIQGSIDTSGVPGIMNTNDAYNYGQSTALKGEMAALDPSLTQDREQLDSSLRNSGATPGTPAYDNAMARLDASQAGARAQAAGQAISAGNALQNTQYGESANTNSQLFEQAQARQAARNAAQSQQFGENFSNAGLNNQAGQTALQDYATATGIPLNELNSILGGTQVTMPSALAPSSSQTSAPDIMGAFNNQYAGKLAGYNADVSSANTTESTVGSLAATAALIYF